MKRNRKGFTLIELLIVVAIIGIIVAIAIPNLLNAIQRAKQKRTMGDIRSIGTAAEAYAVDNNQYPAAAASLPTGLSLPTASITSGGVIGVLAPTYIRLVPTQDGWTSTFKYSAGNANQDYAIRSYGKDTQPDAAAIYGPTTSFNNDIIFTDGQFVSFPEGQQK